MDVEAPRLAIVIPERNVVSESFLSSHIEGLVDDPLVVWGSPRPLFYGDNEGLLSGFWATAAKMLALGRGMTAERAHGAIGRRLPDPVYSRALARFLKRGRVEVVLAEYGPTAVTIMEACSISRTPLVVHFHGFDAYQEETVIDLRESYERLFQTASRVVAVSSHMLAHLVNLGSPPERTVCNSCGVDTQRFQGARPEAAPPLLVALGRFVEKKGPALTLQAFALVHGEESQSRLVMLGDGPLREACVDLAKELGVDQWVDFPGIIDHDEVVGWMRGARCFVQHSLRAVGGDSEGTPVACSRPRRADCRWYRRAMGALSRPCATVSAGSWSTRAMSGLWPIRCSGSCAIQRSPPLWGRRDAVTSSAITRRKRAFPDFVLSSSRRRGRVAETTSPSVLPGAITLAFGRRCIAPAGASLPRSTTGYDFGRETPAGPRIGARSRKLVRYAG